MDELGIWDWMVRDDGDVHALGTQLTTVASELRTARRELAATLGSASTALGWEGQITHRADLHTNPAASLIGRFIEDADAAGASLVSLSQTRDQHVPSLRVLRQDWADLQANSPERQGDQRMVVLFDPREDGRFAEYTGRLDAQNVSVIVPGAGTSMAGMQDYNERFSAIAGAHSAGGAVVGFADLYGADVDSVLHIASAGTGEGVSDASMYPSTTWDAVTDREVERYAQTAPGDFIQIAQRSGEIKDALEGNDLGIPNLPDHIGHGYDPEETPGFTELDTGVWLVDSEARGESFSAGDELEGVFSHDHVIRPGTTSWENIIAVIRADEESMVEVP